ncbi:hypothetical protein FOVSG1_011127 [Fusarium oxysporum f. sp. vasinfectum]
MAPENVEQQDSSPGRPFLTTAQVPSRQSAPSARNSRLPPTCALCQQRKVRCDRQSPCSTCIKAKVECVTQTLPGRHRKRRFPERKLLERLREYEALLRQNDIEFEPLHNDTPRGLRQHQGESESEGDSPKGTRFNSPDAEPPLPDRYPSIKPPKGGKTFWGAITQEFRHPVSPVDSPEGDIGQSVVQGAWDQVYGNDDYLLFSTGMEPGRLVSLHPQPAWILWFWQIYLDNIDPVLKITHAPTLQRQISEASRNLSQTSPALHALMFSIYCAALFSITDDECHSIFGESKNTLSLRYRSGCRHALVNAGFLRTSDLQVLAALLLFLLLTAITSKDIDPRSLSTLTGIPVRIAQRMGLHSESHNTTFAPFEAELRRRLWWQIILLDSRTGEMADCKASNLVPTWDCKLPLNANDSDLSIHGRGSLPTGADLTEALLIMIRTEIAEFVRHADFHLDFASPSLKGMADKSAQQRSVDQLEHMIENKYLIHCHDQVPLHFMAICIGRSLICKWRLSEHLSKISNTDFTPSGAYRDMILSTAIRMIELDTKIRTSKAKGFLWVANFHFPFPAYVYLTQELRRRTTGPLVEQAWDAMSANYDARNFHYVGARSNIYRSFGQMLLKAWEARENCLAEMGAPTPAPPTVIALIRTELAAQRQPGLMRQNPTVEFQMDAASGYAWTPVDSSPATVRPEGNTDLVDLGPADWMFMTDVVGDIVHGGGPSWDTGI